MQTVLVDDDYISIFLTKKLLQRQGLGEGLSAFQLPEEALHYVQQAIEKQEAPSLILLDLNMPVLSGWDFLEALQPYEAELAGRCFIYVLTSSLAPSDKLRADELPLVAGLLHKPLSETKIQAIQAQMLASRR